MDGTIFGALSLDLVRHDMILTGVESSNGGQHQGSSQG